MRLSQAHVSALLLATLLTFCIDISSNKSVLRKSSLSYKDSSELFLEIRRKRSDCKGTWNIDISCNCNHTYCTKESFHQAWNGSCDEGKTCYLINRNPIQWSKQVPDSDLSFSATCKSLEACSDSLRGYSCTCQQGYHVSTHTQCVTGGSISDANESTLLKTLIITLSVLSIAIVVAVLVLRWRCMRMNQIAQYRNTADTTTMHSTTYFTDNQPGSLIIKCNVLIVVDDRDELKICTEQLKAALGDFKHRAVVKRISVFHFCCDNYQVKCDKVIFFLDAEYKSIDRCMKCCKEKIQFLKGQNSVAVVNVERKTTQTSSEDGTEVNGGHNGINAESGIAVKTFGIITDEICSVSNINEVNKWLPCVTKVILNIKLNETVGLHLSKSYTDFVAKLVKTGMKVQV